MNVGILGIGQVGLAIKKIAEEKHKVFVKSSNIDTIKNNKIEILHICIPYSESFVSTVINIINKLNPDLVLVESTVSPGTTDKIYRQTKGLICHSPIRGIHPNLYEGIKTFVKYIGPTSENAGKKARKYYKEFGVRTKILKSAKSSEIAKLMDTTYYGWNIIFQKEMYKICKKNKISFDEAYVDWNKTYNKGYQKLNMKHVVRPVLKNADGKIGGHCIISNCKILEDSLSNPISKSILSLDKSY